MRHQQSGRHLSRTSSHRQAMFANMVISLMLHECIKTTLAKAKELRSFAERIITLAKQDIPHHRQLMRYRLRHAEAIHKLFTDIGPFYQQRPGGYLRIFKCGFRQGDAAPMAVVELVGRREDDH